MIKASDALANFGISMNDARSFINAHLNNPQAIFSAAKSAGLTNGMLGELANGASASQVKNFFQSKGIDSGSLDLASPAGAYLAKLGVSLEDGIHYVQSNLGNPGVLFNAAKTYNLTSAILGELAGDRSASDMDNYFRSAGLIKDTAPATGTTSPGTSQVSDPLADLANSMVTLNTHTGALSTASIRALVIAQTGSANYYRALDPKLYDIDPSDGVLSAYELGINSFPNLPATTESLESVMYGTTIKMDQAFDVSELPSLNSFLQSNSTALNNGDPTAINNYVNLMTNILSTPATHPLFSDAQLQQAVVLTGVSYVQAVSSGEMPGLFNMTNLV